MSVISSIRYIAEYNVDTMTGTYLRIRTIYIYSIKLTVTTLKSVLLPLSHPAQVRVVVPVIVVRVAKTRKYLYKMEFLINVTTAFMLVSLYLDLLGGIHFKKFVLGFLYFFIHSLN